MFWLFAESSFCIFKAISDIVRQLSVFILVMYLIRKKRGILHFGQSFQTSSHKNYPSSSAYSTRYLMSTFLPNLKSYVFKTYSSKCYFNDQLFRQNHTHKPFSVLLQIFHEYLFRGFIFERTKMHEAEPLDIVFKWIFKQGLQVGVICFHICYEFLCLDELRKHPCNFNYYYVFFGKHKTIKKQIFNQIMMTFIQNLIGQITLIIKILFKMTVKQQKIMFFKQFMIDNKRMTLLALMTKIYIKVYGLLYLLFSGQLCLWKYQYFDDFDDFTQTIKLWLLQFDESIFFNQYFTMSDIRGTIQSMLLKGQDPKEFLIEVCRPQCNAYQQKLHRCEKALQNMTHADPELSCMYPLRDWVTCIDGCVQPKIHAQLLGNEFGFIS